MRPTLGVLGGMGPAACIDFQRKVLRATPAATDRDHFRVLVDNDPAVPTRVAAAQGRGASPGPYLHAMAARLVAAGATVLAMPCNTAHLFFSKASRGIGVPWPSLIREGAAAARSALAGGSTVGVLGSAPTVASGMYQAQLTGLAVVGPGAAGQAWVDDAIGRVKAGRLGPETRALVRRAAAEVVAAGAECVLLGCTELPLILVDGDLDVPVVDATGALASACVRVLQAQRAQSG